MNSQTMVLLLLAQGQGAKTSAIKEILKISLDQSQNSINQAIKELKKAGAIDEKKRKLRATGNGRKRLPRIKKQLNYRLPYWLSNWTMLIFDIPEKDKKKRDQLRYRLKKQSFGMIQSSIWVTPRPLKKSLINFVKKNLKDQVKFFRFSINKEDLNQMVDQAWPIKELNQKYQDYVEEAKKRFKLVKEYHWKDKTTKKLALKLLAEVFKDRYHQLKKEDPQLPRTLLGNNWQGFRAFHIYEQLEKYL